MRTDRRLARDGRRTACRPAPRLVPQDLRRHDPTPISRCIPRPTSTGIGLPPTSDVLSRSWATPSNPAVLEGRFNHPGCARLFPLDYVERTYAGAAAADSLAEEGLSPSAQERGRHGQHVNRLIPQCRTGCRRCRRAHPQLLRLASSLVRGRSPCSLRSHPGDPGAPSSTIPTFCAPRTGRSPQG